MADEILLKYKADLRDIENQIKSFGSKLKGFEDKAGESAKNIEGSFKNAFSNISGGILAALSVEVVRRFATECTRAFAEAEKGDQRLLAALKGNKQAFDELNKQAQILQDKLGIDDDVIKKAQTFLAVQNRTADQIERTVNAAVELSAVTGEDLQSAIEKLDATFEGNLGRLTKLDSRFKDLTKEQLANGAAIDLINEKYKGFSDKTLDNTETRLKRVKTFFENIAEDIGSGFGALIAEADVFIQIFSGIVDKVLGRPAKAETLGKETGEAYFKGIENSISGANRHNFETVADELKKNAGAKIPQIEKEIADAREKARKSSNVRERQALNEAATIATNTTLHNENARVERVIQIIEAERNKKKGLFKEQADDEAKIAEEKRTKLSDIRAAEIKDAEDARNEIIKLAEQAQDANDKLEKKASDDRKKEIDDNLEARKSIEALADAAFESNKKIIDAAKALKIEIANLGIDIANELFSFAGKDFDEELSQLEARNQLIIDGLDKEAEALEKKNERGAISDGNYARQKEEQDKKREANLKKFALEEKKLKNQQAQDDWKKAIFDTITSTAVAIMKAAPNIPLQILTAALGALQLANVVGHPPPKFFKGTKYVKGEGYRDGIDTVPAWLTKGERVIPFEKNKKNWEIYEALDENRFKEFVTRKYVAPIIIDFQKRQQEKQQERMSVVMGKAMIGGSGLTENQMKKIFRNGIPITNTKEMEYAFQSALEKTQRKNYGTW